MKNLLIYISPTGSFDNPLPDMDSKEAGILVKVQIDNSLELGWKKQDIMLFTNFNHKYRGIKAHVLKDVEFFSPKPQASKINAILKLFEKGMIKNGQLYWFHDFDAFQMQSITESELELDGVDMALTDYGRLDRWSTGSIFFRIGARDIFYKIKEMVYKDNVDEERALTFLTKNDEDIRKRIKKLNKTYNFTSHNLRTMYKLVIKPIRVTHFHPLGKISQISVERPFNFFIGENKLGIPLITEKLIKIFNKHGITG